MLKIFEVNTTLTHIFYSFAHRPRGKFTANTQNFSFQCDSCSGFLESNTSFFLESKRQKLVQKYHHLQLMKKILDGNIELNTSDKIRKSVTNFLKIKSIYLSKDGKQMKRELLSLVSFTNKLKNST